MYFGAPVRAPLSIRSKSRTRFNAATTTHTEANADQPRTIYRVEAYAKEAQNERDQAENRNAAGRRNHAEAESFGSRPLSNVSRDTRTAR
jgi:hypothetical protein